MCFLSPAAPVSFHHPIFPFFTCSTSAAYRCASFSPFTSRHLLLLFLPLASPSLFPLLRRWGNAKYEVQHRTASWDCGVCVWEGVVEQRATNTHQKPKCMCVLKSVCLLCPRAGNFKSDVQGNGYQWTFEYLFLLRSGDINERAMTEQVKERGGGAGRWGSSRWCCVWPVCVLQLEESAGALPSVYPWELHDFQHVLTRMWRCYGGCIPCSSAVWSFFLP